jgi:exodeoxyribonuclease V alpha subunit
MRFRTRSSCWPAWIYTAITRGRKKVFIVGDPAAYGTTLRNTESKLRCTH